MVIIQFIVQIYTFDEAYNILQAEYLRGHPRYRETAQCDKIKPIGGHTTKSVTNGW